MTALPKYYQTHTSRVIQSVTGLIWTVLLLNSKVLKRRKNIIILFFFFLTGRISYLVASRKLYLFQLIAKHNQTSVASSDIDGCWIILINSIFLIISSFLFEKSSLIYLFYIIYGIQVFFLEKCYVYKILIFLKRFEDWCVFYLFLSNDVFKFTNIVWG